MEIEIKSYSSPDISDFRNFVPEDRRSFHFLLELEIGLKGLDGGDLFAVEVCTPHWILENHQTTDVLFCKNKLIVFEYDFDNMLNKIKTFISTLNGGSWEEIAIKLSRISQWEFDEYKQ